MAQFDFYGSEEDACQILDVILQRSDVRLTHSWNHETSEPKAYTEIDDDLRERLAVNRRLYITGSFSRHPIRLREVRGGECAGTYVVDEHRGGPVMSVSLPMCKKLDHRLDHLGPGDLFCHNVFWTDDNSEYKAPPEVKAAYADLRKRIKSVLRRRRIGDETVWIGDGGFELLQRGEALILIDGNWLDASGAFMKSNLRRDEW